MLPPSFRQRPPLQVSVCTYYSTTAAANGVSIDLTPRAGRDKAAASGDPVCSRSPVGSLVLCLVLCWFSALVLCSLRWPGVPPIFGLVLWFSDWFYKNSTRILQ